MIISSILEEIPSISNVRFQSNKIKYRSFMYRLSLLSFILMPSNYYLANSCAVLNELENTYIVIISQLIIYNRIN